MMRLGLVGSGRWGQNIARTLRSFPDVEVVAVPKNQIFLSGVNGILIATPSDLHAHAALPYIEAGIPTFIEKPMATSMTDAERIRDAAERSGTPVFVGHLYLYHPAIRAALDLAPTLGKVRHLLCEGMNDRPRSGGVIWDWLPHHLSVGRAVFGCEPSSVTAWDLSGETYPKVAMTKFMFGDVPLVSTASWLSPVPRKNFTLVCEGATLVFDDTAERKLVLHRTDGSLLYPDYSQEPPLAAELRAFLQVVRTGQPDAPHIQTGLAVVRSIVAAEKALFSGLSVTIPLDASPPNHDYLPT